MNTFVGVAGAFFFGVVSLSAAIDGTVVNRTSGKPQAHVTVTLVKPGAQGMQTVGTAVTDTSGHFSFENAEASTSGPQLLQANYRGVNYNKLITPNSPTSGVELAVYEVTKSPDIARVAQRMLLLEPSTSRITVNETAIIQNPTSTTYSDDTLGALRFYLPPAANGQVRISARGPQGMPLPRPAEKTEEADIFKVPFAIKPGETEIQITYVLPAGAPFAFHGRVVNVKGMSTGPLRVVAPAGVALAGADIQQVGTEPTTQATIYNVLRTDNFTVDIASADTSESPQVAEATPPIYHHLKWLVALAFSILGVGLLMLSKKRAQPL